jgi:hypothetical protein
MQGRQPLVPSRHGVHQVEHLSRISVVLALGLAHPRLADRLFVSLLSGWALLLTALRALLSSLPL